MVVAVENRASLKSWKMTVVALSLVAVVSTLYVYDDVVYDITDELSSRVLGYKRREKRNAYLRQPRRELVWVMSYPRGGADEIINFVERGTFTSMGTNYGDVLQGKDMQQHNAVYKSELVQKRWYSSGPFKNNVDFDLPAEYGDVLVKTYCTGHCLHMENGKFCSRIPYSRSLVNTDKFWSKCAGGSSYDPKRRPAVKGAKPYWRNRIKKVIVVVRNPLELVTNRWRDHMRTNGDLVSEVNFRNYCPWVDARYKTTKEIKTAFRKRWIKPHVDGVLCVTEFWRIAGWYSKAFAIARNRNPLIIYREEYVKDKQKTTTDVLNYIGMKQTNDKLPNVNTGARLYFTGDEVAAIGNFINVVSKDDDSAVWSHLKRYFEAHP